VVASVPVYDVAVIGGGIAGVSAACELAAAGRRVVVLEQEAQLAHHTTGRSAAVFLESYGPPAVRALTSASRADFDAAPGRFGTPTLLSARPALWVAPLDQVDALEHLLAEVSTLQPLTAADARIRCPALRAEWVVQAAVEEGAADIDVLALHQGYVRGLSGAGGEIRRSWPVTGLRWGGAAWRVESAKRPDAPAVLEAGAVVLAAGAWCDQLAALARAEPIGLRPLRRTIAVCRQPAEGALDPQGPLVSDAAHTWYFKPEGPNVLCSPADETPSEPCDARPKEADVALAIERVNAATTLQLRSVIQAWAGLRTFAPDRVPVVGEDPSIAGLWWLAGQGGYGIQTAPAMARTLVRLMLEGALPADVARSGVVPADLSPARFGSWSDWSEQRCRLPHEGPD
jgi:D-arginine dehydrogenase